jgi:hypothetical protein
MAADPKKSAGARLERRAIRDKLRREMRATKPRSALADLLAWVLKRQQRYDGRKGGLGKR